MAINLLNASRTYRRKVQPHRQQRIAFLVDRLDSTYRLGHGQAPIIAQQMRRTGMYNAKPEMVVSDAAMLCMVAQFLRGTPEMQAQLRATLHNDIRYQGVRYFIEDNIHTWDAMLAALTAYESELEVPDSNEQISSIEQLVNPDAPHEPKPVPSGPPLQLGAWYGVAIRNPYKLITTCGRLTVAPYEHTADILVVFTTCATTHSRHNPNATNESITEVRLLRVFRSGSLGEDKWYEMVGKRYDLLEHIRRDLTRMVTDGIVSRAAARYEFYNRARTLKQHTCIGVLNACKVYLYTRYQFEFIRPP